VGDLRLSPNSFGARVSRVCLRLLRGWKIEGPHPTTSHAVMLAVPHTANLDGLLLVLLTRSIGMRASWMVKDVWVKPPFGLLTKRVGAVPVDRSKANGMVGQMVDRFAASDEFVLIIPPEGTRSSAEHWKSGFYRIAFEANVPVIPAYIDYRTRRGGFGAPITLTGDKRADMDKIRAYYSEGRAMARIPEKFGPIRLSDED
jgi:1-acyl-sn-glycerol-3-phosphate acyltransferase